MYTLEDLSVLIQSCTILFDINISENLDSILFESERRIDNIETVPWEKRGKNGVTS